MIQWIGMTACIQDEDEDEVPLFVCSSRDINLIFKHIKKDIISKRKMEGNAANCT